MTHNLRHRDAEYDVTARNREVQRVSEECVRTKDTQITQMYATSSGRNDASASGNG
jgi:hypothetical protein